MALAAVAGLCLVPQAAPAAASAHPTVLAETSSVTTGDVPFSDTDGLPSSDPILNPPVPAQDATAVPGTLGFGDQTDWGMGMRTEVSPSTASWPTAPSDPGGPDSDPTVAT